LSAYNVAVFAASTDRPEDNKLFAKELELPYPILSDPSTRTARAYGVLKGLPLAMRHTIYIGKDGKVLLVDQQVDPKTAGEEMLKHLESLGIEKRPTVQ
jgi:thioredoxin-dependent peroxiredoxin